MNAKTTLSQTMFGHPGQLIPVLDETNLVLVPIRILGKSVIVRGVVLVYVNVYIVYMSLFLPIFGKK